ncbi:MAG: PIG-L family deacetylase, partial [Nitriliruptoraceae bacterium]
MTRVQRPRVGRHVLFVHAHPDDEASKGAATAARYAAAGHGVTIVTLTDGRSGGVQNPAVRLPAAPADITAVRASELDASLAALGVTDSVRFGYPDSGHVPGFDGTSDLDADQHGLAPGCLYRLPFDEPLERLVAVIRETRPDVLVTYPPDGDCPHPDHTRAHGLTVAAYDVAADASRFPAAGAPWQVAKLYYTQVSNPARSAAIDRACRVRGLDSPFTGCADDDRDDPSTTYIEVASTLQAREQALRAHVSQIDPDGPWLSVSTELLVEVYPYEAFTLARANTPVDLPEHDLFAGLD